MKFTNFTLLWSLVHLGGDKQGGIAIVSDLSTFFVTFMSHLKSLVPTNGTVDWVLDLCAHVVCLRSVETKYQHIQLVED